jgi:hypothetical protein
MAFSRINDLALTNQPTSVCQKKNHLIYRQEDQYIYGRYNCKTEVNIIASVSPVNSGYAHGKLGYGDQQQHPIRTDIFPTRDRGSTIMKQHAN